MQGNDILNSMDQDEPRNTLKKKEKQQLKRDALVESESELTADLLHHESIHSYWIIGLESTHSPYSKSHSRRLKRKSREQIAGGLSDVQAALPALESEGITVQDDSPETKQTPQDTLAEDDRPKAKLKPGQIGEGKGATLSNKQRKNAL